MPAFLVIRCLLCGILLAAVGGTATASDAQRPLVIAYTTEFVLSGKLDLLSQVADEADIDFLYRRVEHLDAQTLADDQARAHFILVDTPRGIDAMHARNALAPLLQDDAAPPLLQSIGREHRAQGLSPTDAERLGAYYRYGGRTNFQRFFNYLNVGLFGREGTVEPPLPLPAAGVYHPAHPERVVSDIADYLNWTRRGKHDERPVVAGLIHENSIGDEQTAVLDKIVERAEAHGLIPLLFYYPSGDETPLIDYLHDGEKSRIDVLFNTRHLHDADGLRAQFERLDVPVIQTLGFRDGSPAEWQTEASGIPSRMVPGFLVTPEYMGLIDPQVIGAVDNGHSMPLTEQIDALLGKARNLANLRRTPRADRQVALFYYNYPSGESNLSASHLNVPRSLAHVSAELAAAGYNLQPLAEAAFIEHGTAMLRPYYYPEEAPALLDDGRAGLLPLTHYRAWLNELPEQRRQALLEHWGEPESHAFVIERDGEHYFIIPRHRSGKLTWLPQPPRRGANIHNDAAPPDHIYLATYLYVREVLGVDAIIHFGTHGSQEWLPGKDRGLAADDWPNLLIADIPVIYPYIVDNIGEALQTKRRGRATTISHQTPPFAPAGLYGDLVELHELIHHYEMLDQGPVRERTREAIVETVLNDTLYKDLGWRNRDIRDHFEHFLHDLHDYLHELARAAQPLALHTFGRSADERHILSTVMQMLGDAYYAQIEGVDIDELFVDNFDAVQNSKPYRLLASHLLEQSPAPTHLSDTMEVAERYFRHLRDNSEIEALLAALDGRYIPTSYGGDPIRNPDSLPTGRNLYGFDPAKLPTPQAYAAGGEALQGLLSSHRQKHGEYPQSLAFSLWSSEAMRHFGVLEAQVLHALGLKPVWDRGGRLERLHIIPADELERPRIDVVVSLTGTYRDQFDPFLHLLAEAIAELARLDEADNAVFQHAQRIRQQLLDNGLTSSEAEHLAAARLFGNPLGRYGTGLPEQVMASDRWQNDSELAAAYLERMQYAYATGDGNWGRRIDGVNLYAEQLKRIDGAVLARSSNLHGLLSTDHPFEFLGGIALATRTLTGASPELYIADLRDPNRQHLTTADRFLAAELRSRYLHPGWIGAMQGEGYAGTLSLLNTVNNVWGWQVMEPGTVRADQWQALHDTYVQDALDLGLSEWFEAHNPHAHGQIIERLLEAVRTHYWDASETTQRELVERYLELVEQHQVGSLNAAFRDYVDELAIGFGLSGAPATGIEAVTGPVLEPVVEHAYPPTAHSAWLYALLLLLIVAAGAFYQRYRQNRL
ncbi:cobaltochelatase subunit CobN [Alkalilimnicola ehrlichii]|nr:cobaltochelatase subunit CobN [Alkalilimnicola ehrlichii]